MLDKLDIVYYNKDANKRKRGEYQENGSSAEAVKEILMKGESGVLNREIIESFCTNLRM